MIRIILLVVTFVFLAACKNYAAFVEAAADPSFRATKSESIYVVVPKVPSITERRLLPVLRDELCKNGFTVAATIEKADWVMGLSQNRNSFYDGSTSTTALLPGGMIAQTQSSAKYSTNETIFLHVFNGQQFGFPNTLAMWEGSATATDNVFRQYEKAMIKTTLDQYGKTFAGKRRLARGYQKQAGGCAP